MRACRRPPPGQADEAPADDPGPNEIAAGTVALFLSLSLDGRDESWPTIDGNIAWEETDIGVLRYLPEGAALDMFASTTSTSFSSNHIYPLTIGHRTFVVSTRGRKRIQEYDSNSGSPIGTSCEIVTNDNYSGFAIVGDRLFYLDDSGDLVANDMPCEGAPATLINAADHGINSRNLFGIGDALISVDTRALPEYGVMIYDTSNAVNEKVLTVGEEDGYIVGFFAGDDALYWAAYAESTRVLTIRRFAVNGAPETILSRALNEDLNAGLAVDASGDQVLVVYMDGFPATGGVAHFLLYDSGSQGLTDLEIATSFYSQRILGTQLLVYE
jgi:hypothetical protein